MGSRTTHDAGLLAEGVAALYLRLRGWRILSRRFKTPVGEIDIVAKRRGIIAFIEVKRRPAMADALSAVSPDNAARVRRASEWWLKGRAEFADKADLRFDVIAIAPYASIRHIPNAF
jgi:putative endonuclease